MHWGGDADGRNACGMAFTRRAAVALNDEKIRETGGPLALDGLGCAFLLPFLQSETPPKGILQESFSFLSEMEDSFFIFLQFGPPPKGTGFLWF